MKNKLIHFSALTTAALTLSIQSFAHDDHHHSKGDTAARELSKEAPSTNLPASGWVKLGDAIMQKSREKAEPALFERATHAYRSALAQDENNEGAMVGLAWVHNTRHEFDEGCDWAKKALKINPLLSQAHALLADAAIELGDYDAGLEHCQKALDIRPDLSTYSRAAHIVWLMGDVRKSRFLMEKAIKAGGRHAENVAWCRAELARIHWHDGALLPAEQQAELAMKAAPSNVHVLEIAAKIKATKRNYEEAIALYNHAIAIHPTHDALVGLGDIYALTGRKEEAEKTYERVVKLNNDHEHNGDDHGHSHREGNAQLAKFYVDHDRNLDEALQEAEQAYKTFKNVFAADTLAWCYYKKGLYDKARDTISQALRWNTPDAGIFSHASLIHAKLGNATIAQKYLSRALNLNPNFDLQNGSQVLAVLKEK